MLVNVFWLIGPYIVSGKSSSAGLASFGNFLLKKSVKGCAAV